jgi:biopolymer transport protein ExbB
MKKVLAFFAIAGFLTFGISNAANAQDTLPADSNAAATNDPVTPPADDDNTAVEDTVNTGGYSFTQDLKVRFIEGDPFWMGVVLICLIFGLALVIERIVYLNLATSNTKKLLEKIEGALKSGGIEAAKEVCRNTRGPVASIFYQGLDRADEGVDMAEKAVVSYGGVQMGLLEKGMSWIALFIALAPMLGFMGTVVGMIQAFDAIATAGTISASVVAGGIKVALLTTVFGLVVAIILQVFYNYLLSKIDGLVNNMEDASIGLIDLIYRHKSSK